MTSDQYFRKRPVEIRAYQLTHTHPRARWVNDKINSGDIVLEYFSDDPAIIESALIHTLEGTMRADVGDWIIDEGIRGKIYPCRAYIFEETYEVVK